jgi:hypothetical protein
LIIVLFIFIHDLTYYDQLSGLLIDIIGNLQFWLTLLVTCYISILPQVILRRYGVLFNDNIINNLRQRKYENTYVKKTYIRKIEEMNKYKRSLAKFKKIYRLQDDYEPDNLNDKKIKDIVDTFKRTKTTQKSSKVGTTIKVNVNKLIQQTTMNNNVPMNINIFNGNMLHEEPRFRSRDEVIANRKIERSETENDSSYEDAESFDNPHQKKLETLMTKLNGKTTPRNNKNSSSPQKGNNMKVTLSNVKEYDDMADIVVLNSEDRALNNTSNNRTNQIPLSKFIADKPLNITNFDDRDYD